MGIRRAIISVILALGAAGSILVGSTLPAAAAQASAAHVSTTSQAVPHFFYHG
jgi:hypothetical protein